MSEPIRGPADHRRGAPDSRFRGGLTGIALVALATLGVSLVAAILSGIALLVAG